MQNRREWLATTSLTAFTPILPGQEAKGSLTAIYQEGETRLDSRLGTDKTLNDYFPFVVPSHQEAWKQRSAELKTQLRTALGIFPEPPKTELNAVIHGRIERPGFTIEKVYFQSIPGHSVCGNLYRPAKSDGRKPAVIFAHGHWANGRFHVVDEASAKKMVDRGEEADLNQARFFMQAIPITLAKLGFVVWQFDMVGYADSTAVPHIAKSGVPHPQGFADADGELRLHSLLGLQAWNCIRSIDFLAALDDVDPKRIGMTGASGGGTQTFLTAALDDRIACAVPAVMVSTGMQGGCVCENCSLLRVGTGNIEIAALIAPRPLALTGANDWTKEIMTKGYPELQKLYAMMGKPEHVSARAWTEFPHNYNRPAREMMYRWMLKHLMGRDEPDYREPAFEPLPVKELSVFDQTHPRPLGELDSGGVRKKFTELTPKTFDGETRRAALKAIIVSDLPKKIVIRKGPLKDQTDEVTIHKALLGRVDSSDACPTIGVFSQAFTGSNVCVWIHENGKGSLFRNGLLIPTAKALVQAGYAIVAPDLYDRGEARPVKPKGVNGVYAGFTYGYNRTPLAERVHDSLTALCFAKTTLGAKKLVMAGLGSESVTAWLAAAMAESTLDRLAIEHDDFRFATIKKADDPMMLPGMLKYGDLPAMIALIPEGKRKTLAPAEMAKWLTGA